LASALARYLVFNLQIGLRWLELKGLLFGGPAMAETRYAGNTSAEVSGMRVRDSLAVIDAFLRDLPEYTSLTPARIALVIDGFRYPADAASAAGSYFDLVRKTLMQKAQSLGYHVVDLDPFFFDHYGRASERFEFARDGHWNRVGHGVAFDALMASPFLTRLVGEQQGMRVGNRIAAAAASGRME
jgi:hypothetical protein